MSRITELTAMLSPGGVPRIALRDAGRWYGGGTPSKARADFWEGGTIPWLSPKDMRGDVVTDTEDHITELAVQQSSTKLLPPQTVALVVRSSILERTLPVALVPVPVTLNQDVRAILPDGRILSPFLAHVLRARTEEILRSCRKLGGSVASINSAPLLATPVPVPPLAVQGEVVAILDTFEGAVKQLEADLQAEQRARRLQFEAVRDALLDFKREGVRWVRLGDLGTLFGGLSGKRAGDFVNGNAPYVSYNSIYQRLAVDLDAQPLVRVEPFENQRELHQGDVLFTSSSETLQEVGLSSVMTTEPTQPTYLNSFSIGLRVNDSGTLNPHYAKHLFRSRPIRSQIIKTASGVTRFNVSKARLADAVVPVPSQEVQRSVSSHLDLLDARTSEISADVLTERYARRKQYEHYRNRLLTFEELRS